MRPILIVALLSACSPAGPTATLTATGFESRTEQVTASVPFEWEATFRDESGALVEPGYLDLLGTPRVDALNPTTPTVTIEDTVLEPGRHRYRATALELKRITIGVEYRTCADASCPLTQLEGLVLEVTPPTEQLVLLSGPTLSLAVTERRAIAALPWGTTRGDLADSRIAWALDAPLTLESSDPTVARIEGTRVVGVAPGTATVTASTARTTGEPLREAVVVTVTDAGVGPPLEGLHPVFGARIDSNEGGARHLQPPLYRQLHVDAQGWPVTVGVLFGNIAAQSMRWLPALVGQWTGTGFETVRVGRSGDAVRSPRLVLDERGHRYVLYRDVGGRLSSSVVVADFDATGPVRYRDLPVRDEARSFLEEHDVTTALLDLTPRTGGGGWAAWVHLEGELSSGPSVCTVRVRLAELTDDAVRVQDVGEAQTLPMQTCNSYHVYKFGQDEAATLFLSAREGLPPDVYLSGLPEFRSVRFSFEGGAWVKTEVPEARRWPGGPLLDVPDSFWPDGIVGDAEPYRIETAGRVWFGNEHPGVLMRGRFFDDPSPRWFVGSNSERTFSSERRLWLTQGVAGTPTRLHQTVSKDTDLRYGVVDVPRRATPDGDETEGRRLAGAEDPWLPIGQSVTASGARFVVLRQQNASLLSQPIGSAYNPWEPTFLTPRQFLRSAAPGLPFAPVTLPTGVSLWPTVIERGGKTWALGWAGSVLHVLSSTDGGQTFTSAFTQQATSAPADVALADGVFFAVCHPLSGESELWRFDLDVTGFAPQQLTAALAPAKKLRASGKLFSAQVGAAWLERIAPYTVRLVRWTRAGVVEEDVELLVPPGDIALETLHVEGATVWGVGRSSTATRVLRRTAGQTGFSMLGAFDARSVFRTPFFRMRAGVLGALELLRTKPDCFQAALSLSTDEGNTWSAPRVVRPRGGCLQLPWGAQSTGAEVVLTLSDNDGLRAWEAADGVLQMGSNVFPAHDTVFLRVAVP
jgi:hypothetical protein